MDPMHTEALIRRAAHMISFKKYKEALEDLQKFLRIDKNNVEALEMKLEVLVAIHDSKEVIECASTILALNPSGLHSFTFLMK